MTRKEDGWKSWTELLLDEGFKRLSHAPYTHYGDEALFPNGKRISTQTKLLLQAGILEREGRWYRVKKHELWHAIVDALKKENE